MNPTTTYLVFKQVRPRPDSDEYLFQRHGAPQAASSAEKAIRLVVGTEAGRYYAVPERNFTGLDVAVETQQVLHTKPIG